jgi:hypothetical protein
LDESYEPPEMVGKQKENILTITRQNEKVPTAEFAKKLGCKPETARSSLCLKGHYMGITPVKLPNGRLMWPLEPALRILQENTISIQERLPSSEEEILDMLETLRNQSEYRTSSSEKTEKSAD